MAEKHKGTCLSDGPTFSFKKASPASPPKRVHQEGAHARNCSTARKLLDLKNGSNSCGRKSYGKSTGNLPMSEQKFQDVIHGEFFNANDFSADFSGLNSLIIILRMEKTKQGTGK